MVCAASESQLILQVFLSARQCVCGSNGYLIAALEKLAATSNSGIHLTPTIGFPPPHTVELSFLAPLIMDT